MSNRRSEFDARMLETFKINDPKERCDAQLLVIDEIVLDMEIRCDRMKKRQVEFEAREPDLLTLNTSRLIISQQEDCVNMVRKQRDMMRKDGIPMLES